jgi:hypothetical protein
MLGDPKCDSCGMLLDPVLDVNRFRHRDCPPPALPKVALDIIERVNRKVEVDE